MRGVFPAIVIFLACAGLTKPAMASGDGGCTARWRLVHHDYDGCSNMAFLSPSNDTRVNLLLLMADLRPPKPGPVRRQSLVPDSPLFGWEEFAGRLEPQPAEETSSTTDTGAQTDSNPCSYPLPADDPFGTALQADRTLKPEERDALLSARKKTRQGCAADVAMSAAASAEKVATTPAAKSYARYLEGASEFWATHYEKSAAIFASLSQAQPAWVRETATYMVGRALINHMQDGVFDEYGNFKKDWHTDPQMVAAAESALDRYLHEYPKGDYAFSARGLKRRAYWLAKDTAKLEEEYGALLLLSPEERNISDVELAEEIDNKILTPSETFGAPPDVASIEEFARSTQSPLLLAMLDLQAMRTEEADGDHGTAAFHPLSLLSLQRQKPYFAAQMPLYEYLLAVHAFYIDKKPAEVLHLIPDAARQGAFGYVQFSRQMLRGMALEALKDHNALAFWTQMLPGAKAAFERPALELAIAYHEERAGEVSHVYAADSPIHDPYMREVLLSNVADAELLRTQAQNAHAPKHEREVALYTLLYKEATLGHAAAFLKDVALVPPTAPSSGYFTLDYTSGCNFAPEENRSPEAPPLGIFLHGKKGNAFGCPELRVSEAQLVQDAEDATAQLCVADFVRLSPPFLLKPPDDELGGTPSQFAGGEYVRMTTYTAVMASAKASRNDKAYALYRAVNCYAPSGNNDCGGKDVPVAQRKAWFTTLKRDYAGTRWASELQYYW